MLLRYERDIFDLVLVHFHEIPFFKVPSLRVENVQDMVYRFLHKFLSLDYFVTLLLGGGV